MKPCPKCGGAMLRDYSESEDGWKCFACGFSPAPDNPVKRLKPCHSPIQHKNHKYGLRCKPHRS